MRARSWPWAAPAALLLLFAGCTPLRVDIGERERGGYTAVVNARDAEDCARAGERAAEEARYFCRIRGLGASLGSTGSEPRGAGCRVELPFWCAGSAP